MLETCVGIFTDRHFPAAALAGQVRAYEAADAVDGFLIPDQRIMTVLRNALIEAAGGACPAKQPA